MPNQPELDGATPPAEEVERLAAACRRRDELLRALIHDLRNPLNGVLTWVHLLRSGRLDEETARHALESVERESELQARLLGEVADYLEISGDEHGVRLEIADPRGAVLAALEEMRESAERGSLRLEIDLGAASAPFDRSWLQRAVRGLLARAIEPANEATRVQVTLRSNAEAVEIEIADDGRGFATAEHAQLFAPATEDGRSIGGRVLRLNLAIADIVARRHGGRLEAESGGIGQGAALRLRLPAAGAGAGGGAEERTGD